MRVYSFPQRSPAWWQIRRGIPTASDFSKIIKPAQGGASTSQVGFIDQLIAELCDQQLSEEPEDSYVSKSMQAGIDREPAARAWYGFTHDVEVMEVGFCLSDCGRFGCSPDGLIGDDGVLEIKCPDLKTHIKYFRENELPSEYKPQCHGELLVTGRRWLDFVSYSPSDEVPSLVIRVVPDDYTVMLEKELERFLARYLHARSNMGINVTRPVDQT